MPTPKNAAGEDELDTDQETDRLLGQQYNDDNGYYDQKVSRPKRKGRERSIMLRRGGPRRRNLVPLTCCPRPSPPPLTSLKSQPQRRYWRERERRGETAAAAAAAKTSG